MLSKIFGFFLFHVCVWLSSPRAFVGLTTNCNPFSSLTHIAQKSVIFLCGTEDTGTHKSVPGTPQLHFPNAQIPTMPQDFMLSKCSTFGYTDYEHFPWNIQDRTTGRSHLHCDRGWAQRRKDSYSFWVLRPINSIQEDGFELLIEKIVSYASRHKNWCKKIATINYTLVFRPTVSPTEALSIRLSNCPFFSVGDFPKETKNQ